MVEETRGGKECHLKVKLVWCSLISDLCIHYHFFHQVHEPNIPADLLQTQPISGLEFTSLSYGPHPTLFIGTNNGRPHNMNTRVSLKEVLSLYLVL